ncbi:hypothetical protein TCAL_17461 [Tigriopus californicus]|uniref:C2H2-type domain-containing protein n=1 Tax=Tigriopus californicus TaxID=6832 RepID=A0A553PK48_TIGCA|nr:hypothetical protein TCAL_17461 [Tigriopus californicus]
MKTTVVQKAWCPNYGDQGSEPTNGLAAFSPFLKECLLDEPVYLCDKILQLHLPDYSHAAITDFLKVLYGCEDNEEQVLSSLEAVESLWRQECDYKGKNNNTTRQHIYRFHFGRNRDWYQRTKAKRNRDGTPVGVEDPNVTRRCLIPTKPEPKDSSSGAENSDDGSQSKEKINYNKAYADEQMSKHCFNYHGVKLPFNARTAMRASHPRSCWSAIGKAHLQALSLLQDRHTRCQENGIASGRMQHEEIARDQALKIKNRRRRRPGYEEIEFEPNKEDPTKCPKCDYRNPKLTRVRGHYVSRHIRQQCPHCDKKLLFASMERHILMNHRPDLLKFECKDCNKKFFNERLLKFHNEENHIKELKYICDHLP